MGVWRESFRAAIAPDPRITLSAWADRHGVLPPGVTSRPGPWRTEDLPFLREIMDELSPMSRVEIVVVMKSAQIAVTETAINWVLAIMDIWPTTVMVVQPTVELGKAFSIEKLGPRIAATRTLDGKVVEQRRADGGSTTHRKEFAGGRLIITGANSAAGLRQRSVNRLIKDDLDAWPADADGEGDPSKLADQRLEAAWRPKTLEISTPTEKGTSRIEARFEAGDRRYYQVPCPDCGELQRLVFGQLKWDAGKPETATYQCVACGSAIPNSRKLAMLRAGKWVASAPGNGGGKIASFHISRLYSPFRTWPELAAQYEAAGEDPKSLKVFTNTALGETWAGKGEAPEWQRLYERRAGYPIGMVPPGALLITAGVDVQGDRLELEIVGWGPGETSWSIDYRVLWGDPTLPEVWAELAGVLDAGVEDPRQQRRWSIDMTAIDTGGHWTETVYAWVRGRPRTMAIKGHGSPKAPALGKRKAVEFDLVGKAARGTVSLWMVGVWTLKEHFYALLGLARDGAAAPPPGYCHFPQHEEAYFKGLTAERKMSHTVKGFERTDWVKLRPNEPLDCRVYAMAAARHPWLGIDRMTPMKWAKLAELRNVGLAEPPQSDLFQPVPADEPPAPRTAFAGPTEPAPSPLMTMPPPVAQTRRGQIRGRVS